MRQSFLSNAFCRGILQLLILLLCFGSARSTFAELPAVTDAANFTPKPGLRIFVTGILGSDGTRFETTLVTAKLDDEQFVTEAEVELAYAEYRQPMQAVPRNRAVWRYVGEEEDIARVPLVTPRGQKKYFWLPTNVKVGTQWKAPWGNRREIMENNVTVETPAGRFDGCILVEYDVYAGGTGIERHYIAPGVGLVKIVSLKGPLATKGYTWYEVQRVETIPQEEAGRIVSQMLGL